MKAKTEFRIVVALDLSLQSGRERLDGFYRYADRKGNWEVLIVPNVEASSGPMMKDIVGSGIDGAIVYGACAAPVTGAIFSAGVPIVAIDRLHHPTRRAADAYVLSDNKAFGREAARYFDSLGRFAAYGFVPDPDGREWSKARGKAFMTAVAQKHRNAIVSEQ